MSNSYDDANNLSPSVLIIAGKNLVAEKLIEKLLSENLDIVIYSNDKNLWKDEINKNVINSGKINVVEDLQSVELNAINYTVCLLNHNTERKEFENYLNALKHIIGVGISKTVAVFAFKQNIVNWEEKEKITDELLSSAHPPAIVFSGEIVDELVSAPEDDMVNILKKAETKGVVKIAEKEKYHFLITTKSLVDQIIYSLFSFGSYGKKIAVVSKPTSEGELYKFIKSKIPDVVLEETGIESFIYAKVDDKVYVQTDVHAWLSILLDKIRQNSVTETVSLKTNPNLIPVAGEAKQDAASNNDVVMPKFTLSYEQPKVDDVIVSPEPTPIKVTKDNKTTETKEKSTALSQNVKAKKQESLVETTKRKLKQFKQRNEIKTHNLIARRQKDGSFKLKHKKSVLYATSVLVVVLIALPLVSLGSSFIFLYYANNAFANMNISSMKTFSGISRNLSNTSLYFYSAYDDLPNINTLNKPLYQLADFAYKNSKLYWEIANVFDRTNNIIANSLQNKTYDIEKESGELAISLDNLYSSSSYLKGDSENSKLLGRFSNKDKLFNNNDARQMLLPAKDLAAKLPQLLGKGKPVTYLVLFQNERIAKPSGGDIAAMALLTFSNGNLINQKLIDPLRNDGLLKGHIDPPDAIRTYFGKNTWVLKDANWFSDFPTSAEKIKWFADKTMDVVVDGVIVVNLDYSTKVLGISTSKNQTLLDEKLNNASVGVDSDLTSLVSQLIQVSQKDSLNMFNSFIGGYKSKNIMVYLDDNNAQEVISDLGLDGWIEINSCESENCYTDIIGVVENQISTNAVNIGRMAETSVVLEGGVIKRNLMLFFDNSKNNEIYETYLRVIADENAGFAPVVVVSHANKEKTTPETTSANGYKEAGIYLMLKPGESKALMFSWESQNKIDYTKHGRYDLVIYKQPGIAQYNFHSQLSVQDTVKISETNFSLTQEGGLSYNTTLSQDINLFIEW